MSKIVYQLPKFEGRKREDFFDGNQLNHNAVKNHPLTKVHTKEEFQKAPKSAWDMIVKEVDGVEVIYGFNEEIW